MYDQCKYETEIASIATSPMADSDPKDGYEVRHHQPEGLVTLCVCHHRRLRFGM